MPGGSWAARARWNGGADVSARYVVHKGDETLTVAVTEEGTGYRVEIDGDVLYVDSRSTPGSPTRSIIIDGRSYEAACVSGRDGMEVYLSGDVFHVRVTDELWARAEEAAHGTAGGETVASPMPGSVVKVLVKEGEVVARGRSVAVVEAMKMQNDLACVSGGRVAEVRVKAGDVVDQGTVLVVLVPEDAEGTAEEA